MAGNGRKSVRRSGSDMAPVRAHVIQPHEQRGPGAHRRDALAGGYPEGRSAVLVRPSEGDLNPASRKCACEVEGDWARVADPDGGGSEPESAGGVEAPCLVAGLNELV